MVMEAKFLKKILFIYLIILGLNHNVFSQEQDTEKQAQDKEKNWTIQTSPFLLFSDIFDVNDMLFIMDMEGQHKLSKYSNISLTLSFLYYDHALDLYDSDSDVNQDYGDRETYFQIGFKPMYINRPFGTGLAGLFIGVYPNLGFRYYINGDKNTFYTELGFGLNIGYKWIFDSGFTMQVGGGLGKTFSIPRRTNYNSPINSDGRLTVIRTDIFVDFKLGYSF